MLLGLRMDPARALFGAESVEFATQNAGGYGRAASGIAPLLEIGLEKV